MQLKTVIEEHLKGLGLPETVSTHYLAKACQCVGLRPDDEVPRSKDPELATFIIEAKRAHGRLA
jgi:hypothetical protein